MIRVLASLMILLALALPAAAARRVALVIGNGGYKFVTSLANPINDAARVEAALKAAGFEVLRKDNLDRQGLTQAMADFTAKLSSDVEASMFYYAGHGIEVNGTNYLVPVDANMQSGAEAETQNVSVNDYLKMIGTTGVPFNILVLDACRDNPFANLTTAGKGLAPILAPVGTYIAYATAPGAIALDGDGKNSPFTEALSRAIALPGLRLEETFKETRAQVFAATNGQQTTYDSSAIVGTFYFREPLKPGLKQAALAAPSGKTIHVEPVEGDIYGSIANAVKQAKAGDRIELAPGVYDANVRITKAIQIVGPGKPELVTLRGWDSHTLEWTAQGGLLANVTVKQLATPKCGNECNAVNVNGGTLTIRNSTLTSDDGSVIEVLGDAANLHFINSVISNADKIGISFSANSSGLVEESDFFSNGGDAIAVAQGAKVIILNNLIHDGKSLGISVANKAVASIESNHITGNNNTGIEIFMDAVADVRNNVITNNREFGVNVWLGGSGTFVSNDLRSNAQGPWKIWEHAGKLTRENNVE
jgi:hypothetical protein